LKINVWVDPLANILLNSSK